MIGKFDEFYQWKFFKKIAQKVIIVINNQNNLIPTNLRETILLGKLGMQRRKALSNIVLTKSKYSGNKT